MREPTSRAAVRRRDEKTAYTLLRFCAGRSLRTAGSVRKWGLSCGNESVTRLCCRPRPCRRQNHRADVEERRRDPRRCATTDATPPSVPTNVRIVASFGCPEFLVGWTQSTIRLASTAVTSSSVGAERDPPCAPACDCHGLEHPRTGQTLLPCAKVERRSSVSCVRVRART
jgi:hypothetical protein